VDLVPGQATVHDLARAIEAAGYRDLGRHTDRRGPAERGHGHRDESPHDADDQAESVLGLCLQPGADPSGRRDPVSLAPRSPEPNARRTGHGLFLRFGGEQQPKAEPLPSSAAGGGPTGIDWGAGWNLGWKRSSITAVRSRSWSPRDMGSRHVIQGFKRIPPRLDPCLPLRHYLRRVDRDLSRASGGPTMSGLGLPMGHS